MVEGGFVKKKKNYKFHCTLLRMLHQKLGRELADQLERVIVDVTGCNSRGCLVFRL